MTRASLPDRKLLVAFGSAIAILLVIGAYSYRSIVASNESNRWVRHTHEVLDNLQNLRLAMETMSSSIRRYILTAEDATLEIYRASKLDADDRAAQLRLLTADNADQQTRLPQLESLVAGRAERADRIVGLRQTGGIEAALSAVRGGPSQQMTSEFQVLINQMHEEELRLLALREAVAESSLDLTKAVLVLGTLLGLLVTAGAGWSVQRDSSRRELAEDALFAEKERAQVTLNSIGDAVACTDIAGNLTFLNAVAETMTGWTLREACGRPMAEVLRIVDSATRQTIPDPMQQAIALNRSAHLPDNCVLIRRDGFETPIEDSVAPIHDRAGQASGAVIVFRDVTVARAMALQMAHAAEHDFLTGLPNRMLLNDRIKQAIALAPRHLHKVAVLFLDLDGFKQINDTLGHDVGDKLLQSVTRRLVECVRASDTVSRQGGDEFVVLLSEVQQLEDAAITARRMLHAVAQVHPIGGNELRVSTSIGISAYPDDGLDADTLIKTADTAMYQAKESGGQCYRFFKPAMHAHAEERQSLAESVSLVPPQQELALHDQPK